MELGHAASLVLRDLERASGAEVVALAVGDLVAAGAWELAGDLERRHRSDVAPPILVPCNRRPPSEEPLAFVDELLRATPKSKLDGASGRSAADFAALVAAREPGAREVVDRALDAFVAERLIVRGKPYVIGAFRANAHTRSEWGESLATRRPPALPREAAIAKAMVADALTVALRTHAVAERGERGGNVNGDNVSSAVRYGLGA